MSKHSPGPWRLGKFEPFGMYLPDNTSTNVIGSIFANDETASRGPSIVIGSMVDKPDLANARLIAAAPDMLEALKAIAKKAPHDVSREEAADMACEFVLVARAAIAKATGGEP